MSRNPTGRRSGLYLEDELIAAEHILCNRGIAGSICGNVESATGHAGAGMDLVERQQRDGGTRAGLEKGAPVETGLFCSPASQFPGVGGSLQSGQRTWCEFAVGGAIDLDGQPGAQGGSGS